MFVKSAIKYFFLSFFSNPLAEESRRRGLWQGILSFLLGLALFFCGLTAGSAASFSPLYKKAGSFREFLYKAADNAVTVEVKDGKARASIRGENNAAIDTFANDADAAVYSLNGYNLIIDTRDEATTYNDFTLTYVLNGKEYSAEEWRSLSEKEKKNYSVKVNYSSSALVLTKEKAEGYAAWILGAECDDKAAKEKCRALLNDAGELSEKNYNAAYELYVSAYYSDLSKIERYGKAPTMRSYYMNTYLAADKNGDLKYDNFVVILQNIYFCYFTTDSGVTVSTNGYFKDMPDLTADSPAGYDELFSAMHAASSDIVAVNYFLYLVRVAMFALIAWIVSSLLISVCGWIGRCADLKEYGSAFKSFATFWLFSGVTAAIASFVGSFFLSRTAGFWLGAGLYIGLAVFRAIEQNIYVFAKRRKEAREEAEEENVDSD